MGSRSAPLADTTLRDDTAGISVTLEVCRPELLEPPFGDRILSKLAGMSWRRPGAKELDHPGKLFALKLDIALVMLEESVCEQPEKVSRKRCELFHNYASGRRLRVGRGE